MNKLSIFLLALVAGVGTIYASDTQVNGIWYDFDSSSKTATVTYQGDKYYSYMDEYSGLMIIPSSVTYNNKTYTVTGIGDYAFRGCSGLTSVTIPNSVTSIGDWAFWGCTGLTSVTIPNSVTSIGSGAFEDCSGLTSVTIPNSVTSIGDWAFYNVPNIVYNGTATGSPWGAKSVNGYVDGYFVYSDESKTTLVACFTSAQGDIIIPNSVTGIGDYAFRGCSGLTSVTIPNSVTSIGSSAFEDCSGLTSVTIPNSVTSIGNYAFDQCTGLTSVTIPNSVTSIGDLAFALCIGLTSVTIPNSVTSIGDGAFLHCTGLASVTIPNSITSIGNSAFEDCSGLTSVTIPNSVTSIGFRAFCNCSGLISVTIPNSVTSIGDRAFYNCSGLISITNYATTPQSINSDVFSNVNKSTCVLNVPTKSVSLYQAADVWKEFTNILGVDDYTINYVDKDSQALYNHVVTLYVPVAPTITGFKFLKWVVVNGDLDDGITIQAVYQADVPSAAPEVYTNPSNPAQKLIRNGNVYILTDDKTYTIQGNVVK